MNILLTFDYELFFGSSTGTPQRCMINPAAELIRIAERHDVRFSFFADTGYLVRLQAFKHLDPLLEESYQAIKKQLKYLADAGHDVQLHIHPHWEDTVYENKSWKMDTRRYRLHQFSDEEIEHIITTYSKTLTDITGQSLHTFRAGGWCLQPFEKLKSALSKAGIRIDSSVFRDGFESSAHYFYDFRNCPDKDFWTFSQDPAKDEPGTFTELPISSLTVSPLFYWKLYLLGRLNPSFHKPVGDGRPILSKGYKKRILSRFTRQPVTLDGYNARLIQGAVDRLEKRKCSVMVILGHPKALSPYSLETLNSLIERNKTRHRFVTYSDFKKQQGI